MATAWCLFVPLTRLSALWGQGLHYLLCIHNFREWRRCSLHGKKEWMHSWQQKFQGTQHFVYVIGKIIFSWLYKHSPQSCITTTIWSSLLWQVSNGTFISILSSFSFPILYCQMNKLNPVLYTYYPLHKIFRVLPYLQDSPMLDLSESSIS